MVENATEMTDDTDANDDSSVNGKCKSKFRLMDVKSKKLHPF